MVHTHHTPHGIVIGGLHPHDVRLRDLDYLCMGGGLPLHNDLLALGFVAHGADRSLGLTPRPGPVPEPASADCCPTQDDHGD